jgi:hypothetical protein
MFSRTFFTRNPLSESSLSGSFSAESFSSGSFSSKKVSVKTFHQSEIEWRLTVLRGVVHMGALQCRVGSGCSKIYRFHSCQDFDCLDLSCCDFCGHLETSQVKTCHFGTLQSGNWLFGRDSSGFCASVSWGVAGCSWRLKCAAVRVCWSCNGRLGSMGACSGIYWGVVTGLNCVDF